MVTESEKIKNLLLAEFVNSKAKNPQFSMRAFSRRVGVPQSAISEILNGKRSITGKMAQKILSGLNISADKVLALQTTASDGTPFVSIDMSTYAVIADWQHYAILSLLQTQGARSTPEWIAARLKISPKTAEQALEKLQFLDLIRKHPKTKKWVPTHEHVAAASPIATAALKKANKQNLDLASEKLESTQFSERDFTAITLCFDPERMQEAKEMIQKFRRDFCKAMENGSKKEVFKMCIQLFPLSEKGSL